MSSKKPLGIGVPQGYIFSPVLFSIYLNDLSKALPGTLSIAKYADDVALWITGPNILHLQTTMNAALASLAGWLHSWRMSLNVAKCQATLFTHAQQRSIQHAPINLLYEGQTIPLTDAPVYLGVTFDKKLHWQEHIHKFLAKANRKLAVFQCLTGMQWGFRSKQLTEVYKTYIRPVLEYASPVWHPNLPSTSSAALNSFQGRALRMIHAMPKQTCIAALEVESNITPLHIRRHAAALQKFEQVQRLPDQHCLKHHLSDYMQVPLHKWQRLQRTNFADYVINYQPELPRPAPTQTPTLSLSPLQLAPDYFEFQLSNDDTFDLLNTFPSQDWLHVYTDASLNLTNSTAGIGCYLLSDLDLPIRHSELADSLWSIMELELKDLLRGLTLSRGYLYQHPQTHLALFSDSMSALLVLQTAYHTLHSPSDLVFSIQQTFTELYNICQSQRRQQHLPLQPPTHFLLKWVPGHAGICGNEIADTIS